MSSNPVFAIEEFSSASDAGIDGLVIISIKRVTDDRGTINEIFRRSALEGADISLAAFEQVNVTESVRGAVRGMHAEPMTKLCAVAAGEVHGAWVDLRPGSPTVGAIVERRLRPGDQVLVPPGVANGFQSLTDHSLYLYCFDAEWAPDAGGQACTPLDPRFDWPIDIDPDNPAQISAKDAAAPTLADLGVKEP